MRSKLLGFLCILLACFGCATAGVPGYDGVPETAKAASQCLQTGPCTVVHVDNANWQQATLYANGAHWKVIEGGKKETYYLPNRQLTGGGCLVIFVRLQNIGLANSTKECVRGTQAFSFTIEPNGAGAGPLAVWLNPEGR